MNNPVVNIKDTDTIKCSNCSRDLLIVPTHDQGNEVMYMLRVDCPFCLDHSYDYEVKGPLRYHPAEGVKIKNFVQDGKKVRFETLKG